MIKDKLEYKPPWFTLQVIGIAGASASGKTSVAKALVKKLNVRSPISPVPELC
jgi:uridine kinase